MDDHLVHTKSNQTITLPKRMFFKKPLFKSSLLLNGSSGIQECPPTYSDDLCPFYSIFILILWYTLGIASYHFEYLLTGQTLRLYLMSAPWPSLSLLAKSCGLSLYKNSHPPRSCGLSLKNNHLSPRKILWTVSL